MMLRQSALLTLMLLVAFASPARAETPNGDLVAAGRSFAQRVCGACHVVTPQSRELPLLSPPGPGFAEIGRAHV